MRTKFIMKVINNKPLSNKEKKLKITKNEEILCKCKTSSISFFGLLLILLVRRFTLVSSFSHSSHVKDPITCIAIFIKTSLILSSRFGSRSVPNKPISAIIEPSRVEHKDFETNSFMRMLIRAEI